MKKHTAPLLLCLAASALIVGCGGGSEPDAAGPNARRLSAASVAEAPAAPALVGTWNPLPNPNYAPPNGPYARAWTEMTWDPLRQEMVIFGGNGATGYENDIWSYNSTSTNWTLLDPQVACPGNSGFSKPNGTDDSNFKYDPVNNLYWVFGAVSGYRCQSSMVVRTAAIGSNTTTIVAPDLSSTVSGEYLSWRVRVDSQEVGVSGYAGASKTLSLDAPITGLTAGTSYKLYAHSGAGVWYFDPSTRAWTGQNTPMGNIGPIPSGARIAPAVAYSDAAQAFVLFGGKVTGAIDRQVWRLDVRTKLWTQLPLPAGATPPNLREMLNSFVYDRRNDVFILFGGACADSQCVNNSYSGSTWAYKLSTNSWTNMNPANAPSPRNQQVMAYDDEHGVITLFGGGNGAGALGDSWYYDFASNTWTQLSPSVAPSARYLAQITYDPVNKRTVVFGGQAPQGGGAEIWALKLTPAANAPTVTLTAPTAGSAYTAPAMVVLQAAATSATGSITKVEYFAGASKIGEASLAPFTFTWNNVAAGNYAVTARATDNLGVAVNSAATVVTVNAGVSNNAPTVSLNTPAGGSVYTAPASIALSAAAADSDGSIAKVEFFAGATKIGEAINAPYNITWNGVAAGNYSVTARATDNLGLATTSAVLNLSVNAAPVNQPPSVSLSGPVGGSVYTAPASIPLSASAADSDGSVAKVEFFLGAVKLGEASSAPYAFTWSNVAAGSYTLTARATDNLGASTLSAAITVTVNPAPTGSAVNVALAANGGVASASSTFSSSYPVSAINDGVRRGSTWGNGGGWNDATATTYPDWAQISFSGVKTINRIDVITLADNFAAGTLPTLSTTFAQYGLTQFEVQYWSGSAWVTVPGGSVSNNNLVWRSFSFPAVSTDRVRISIAASLYWYSRIVEIEAWTE